MIMYSWSLTLVALAVLPLQIVLTLVSSPIYRQQLKQEAESNAKTQSHLVEVLTNIQSVKSQASIELNNILKNYFSNLSENNKSKILNNSVTDLKSVN